MTDAEDAVCGEDADGGREPSSRRRFPRFWEVWPRLHRYLALTVVLAGTASGWSWHYLLLARRGLVGPSYGWSSSADSPVLSYVLGVVGFGALAAGALFWLVLSVVRRRWFPIER